MYSRSNRLFIPQSHIKVLGPLESQSLLRARLAPSRENSSNDRTGGSSSKVGSLDVVNTDILNFDILGFKLAREGGAVESCTEDGCFICVNVHRNLFPNRRNARQQCLKYCRNNIRDSLSNSQLNGRLNHRSTRSTSCKNGRSDVLHCQVSIIQGIPNRCCMMTRQVRTGTLECASFDLGVEVEVEC